MEPPPRSMSGWSVSSRKSGMARSAGVTGLVRAGARLERTQTLVA